MYHVEQEVDEGERIRISGDLELEMSLLGYVHFGGNDECLGDAWECMDFSFSFWHENGKIYNFQIERK